MSEQVETPSPRIWVFIEQEDGRAHPVSWELLGAAERLAAELPGSVVEGVLLGHNVAGIAPEAYRYGARRVYLIDDPVLETYRNMPYGVGVSRLVTKYKPEIFLIGATTLGPRPGRHDRDPRADRPDRRLHRAGDRSQAEDPGRHPSDLRRQPDGDDPLPQAPPADGHRAPARPADAGAARPRPRASWCASRLIMQRDRRPGQAAPPHPRHGSSSTSSTPT